jgi:hypothetical protein
MKMFTELIDRPKAIPEGDGTMLDNAIVVHGSELGQGNWHKHDNMPFFIAGGSAGGIKGNRVLDFKDEKHSKILVSIAQFMGHKIDEFADQHPNGRPLPRLV